MDDSPLRADAFNAAESWSVSYGGEVYWYAFKINGDWYYRGSFGEGFQHFPLQEKVTPICKNLTRTKAAASREK
jgi:hypothetical protein